jgi:hypothetical protein
MSEKNKLEQWSNDAPKWLVNLMPLISAVAGIVGLWATWFFYQDEWNSTSFPWFRWIQPALMVFAGFMCLVAAVLFAVRKRSGWDVLLMAMSIIPIIFALRLVIIILIFIGFVGRKIGDNASRIMDGTFFDQISLSPRNIVIQIAILVIVVVIFLFNRADKAKKSSKEK